jgi:hypothetical protein
MLRLTWFWLRILGLGAALLPWMGCGAADNDGDLDVLSKLSDGGSPPEHPDGGPLPESSDGGSLHETNNSGNCAAESVACRTCRTVTMCLAPWVSCTADGPCMRADRTATACICEAQMTDLSAIASCKAAFLATGTQAAILTDCSIAGCAAECGL